MFTISYYLLDIHGAVALETGIVSIDDRGDYPTKIWLKNGFCLFRNLRWVDKMAYRRIHPEDMVLAIIRIDRCEILLVRILR